MMSSYTPTLAHRIMGLIFIGLLVVSWLMVSRSEKVLEDVLLDQVKQHANVFLLGLEQEILELADPLDSSALQTIIDKTIEREHLQQLGFVLLELYLFNSQGEILAHSNPGKHRKKKMNGHYADVFNKGKTYLGDKIESIFNPATGKQIPKVDIIIPLHYRGQVAAAIEVEINLEETVATIKELANMYEREMLLLVVGSTLFILFFVWLIVQRWMFNPLQSIAKLTERISSGEFDARLEITRRDELGSFSESVNRMADSIEQLFTEQEEAHLQMLQSLTRALEAKDSYTAGHSARVSRYSVKLGRRIGLPDYQLKLLKQGALMHDLGKIGISEAILNKPAKLNDREYEIMCKHPVMTASIMRPLVRFKEFVEIAAWHHERWDGKGYPDGIKGKKIPLLARIVSIADAWDAMTGDRVYRKGMSEEEALTLMEKEKYFGQWDPELLGVFIEMIWDEKKIRSEVRRDAQNIKVNVFTSP